VKVANTYTLVATVSFMLGCSSIPNSVREYAAALPARADGQYAVLDTVIKKQLVLMDALLPCAIDVADKKAEKDSPACKCSKSISSDWAVDCKPWLGSHVPVVTGSSVGPGTGPNTGANTGAGSN